MASDTSNINGASSKKSASTSVSGALTGKNPNEQINKNQFLQLLVTQLKNQDPLDPMNSDQFAVNLAQFSQLEQLMSINDKIGAQNTTDTSNLPSYLGREVTLSSTTVHSKGGNAGQLSVELANGVDTLTVGLFDSSNRLVDTKDFSKLTAGKHILNLDKLQLPDGDYTFKAEAVTASGSKLTPSLAVSGLITGFVPGPNPKLLMGNTEVPLSDIAEVRITETDSQNK